MNLLLLYPFAPSKFERFYDVCCKQGWNLTLLTTQPPPFSFAGKTCDLIYTEDISRDVEEVLATIGDRDYDGIIPFSEFSVILTEHLSARLGKPHNALEKAEAYRDKHKMRLVLEEAGVGQPKVYARIDSRSDLDRAAEPITYPCIIKPVDAAGSLHVRQVSNEEELRQAVDDILGFKYWEDLRLRLAGAALVEDYIPGQEYSAEVILKDGEILFLTNVMKVVSALPYCDEIGHILPAPLDAEQQAMVRQAVEKISRAFAYRLGVMHLEYKFHDGMLKVIEIGFRIAGDRIPDLVEHKYRLNLEEASILLRLNEQPVIPTMPELGAANTYIAIKFLFHGLSEKQLPNDIRLIHRHTKKTDKFTTESGAFKDNPTSALNRAGFIISESANWESLQAYIGVTPQEPIERAARPQLVPNRGIK